MAKIAKSEIHVTYYYRRDPDLINGPVSSCAGVAEGRTNVGHHGLGGY